MTDTRVSPDAEIALPKRLAARKHPRQQRSIAIVGAMVEAGTRVLVRDRWSGLAIQSVCEVAGVSPGSFYQYFADKESLVTEIIERVSFQEMQSSLRTIESLDPGASVEAGVTQLLRASFEFQRDNRAILDATLEALPHLGRYPRLSSRVQRCATALRVWMLNTSGWSEQKCRVITHVIVNAATALTHDGVLGRDPKISSEELETEALRLVQAFIHQHERGMDESSP